LGSQLSVAVGVAKEGVAGHSMVEGPGNDEITGGVVSLMATVAEMSLRTGSTLAGQPWPGSKLPTAVALLTWSPRHSSAARTRKLTVQIPPIGSGNGAKVSCAPGEGSGMPDVLWK